MTHAFFKALCSFLRVRDSPPRERAGHPEDGRLRKRCRGRIAILVGSLALDGLPPFSGYFSKDEILASALASGGYGQLLFAAGLVGTLLTGIYLRLLFIVFLGEPSPLVHEHDHGPGHGEGPWTMTVPVTILAVLAVVGGWLQVAGVWHPFGEWLDPIAVGREHLALVEPTVTQDWVTSAIAVSLGALGIWVAWVLYGARTRPVPRFAAVQRALEHKFWFNKLLPDLVFYKPAVFVSGLLRRGVEEPLIGGSIDGVTLGAREAAGVLGEAQTGYLRTYALAIAGAVAVLVVVFITVQ